VSHLARLTSPGTAQQMEEHEASIKVDSPSHLQVACLN
jgi:hypothetical protein